MKGAITMQQLKLTKNQMIAGASATGAVLIVLIVVIVMVTLNHPAGQSAPSQAESQALPSLSAVANQPASQIATATDPYADYSAQQVMQAYVTAYQSGDWSKCRALLSPMVLAGWTTPDELKLKADQVQKERGQLTVKSVAIRAGSDQGDTVSYVVVYHRSSDGLNTQAAGAAVPMGGGPTATAAPVTVTDEFTTFTLVRINNSWKVRDYTVI